MDKQGRITLPKSAREYESFEDSESDDLFYVAIERTGQTSRAGLAPFKETEVK